MRSSVLGLAAGGVALPALLALYSCGSTSPDNGFDVDGSSNGGDGAGGDAGGDGYQGFGDGGMTIDSPPPFQEAGFTAPDCPGCTFPPMSAPPCPGGTPAITVVYPNDGALVPPNMNVISVQWTPYGAPFKEFEVDFENSITDMRVITKCAAQTMDTEQPPQPSGGCELALDPNMWTFVANHNRGQASVLVSVRGTTDGTCATKSASQVNLAFAADDMLGAIYYWKSTVSANGTGGQIWVKSFGDSNPEQLVTANKASCNGCHSLSRDGIRMVINSDDDDSDDEYTDVSASLIDMTTRTPIGGGGFGGGMSPGFASFFPDHTEFVISNGPAGQTGTTAFLYDGVAGGMQGNVSVGGMPEPTMPDWSPDGKSVVFVIPSKGATWTGTYGDTDHDDDHLFGGSIFLLPYMGSQQFGSATALLQSAGENNYYPGFSPDGQLIVFDRAPSNTSVSSIDGCIGNPPQVTCPNDSFSNPNARVMIMKPSAGAKVVDLERANGSPAAAPVPLSNSWPKWSPFLQSYGADKLLWIAFSSTRDYGIRVRNHQTGMYQCYPADSFEDPGSQHGQPFDPKCQQPQLWMAAVDVSQAEVNAADPSKVGFWLPFQDITTHNHTPQWTQKLATQDAGACVPSGGNCQQAPCCTGLVCQADGTCGQITK
jgi:hypothetical protein